MLHTDDKGKEKPWRASSGIILKPEEEGVPARWNAVLFSKKKTFTRRGFLLVSAWGLCFGGVLARLYSLQVSKHSFYKTESDDNQFNQKVVLALRGDILDRFGALLATNGPNYRVVYMPVRAAKDGSSLRAALQALGKGAADEARIKRAIRQRGPQTPILIAENLDWEAFSAINLKSALWPGIVPEEALQRSYPEGVDFCHTVGFVGAVNEEDLKAAEDRKKLHVMKQPGYKIGRQGLEAGLDASLRGKAGLRLVQVNALGREIRSYDKLMAPSIQGSAQKTTLVADLQSYIFSRIREDVGSVVVMDCRDGDILAMVSKPGFDPNILVKGMGNETWSNLISDPRKPLLARGVAGIYPPGSTFKMITALSALAQGVDPERKITCTGKMHFGDRWYHCWKREKGHGSVAMRAAIAQSCDVYFWELAKTLDIDVIAQTAALFGLGKAPKLPLPGIGAGLNPDRAWKKAYFASSRQQQRWYAGDTLSIAIGQGYSVATPLQLAIMMSKLVRNASVKPRLLFEEPVTTPDTTRLVPESHMRIIHGGLHDAVNRWKGTAFASRATGAMRMAGKTGTSQVISLKRDPDTGELIEEEDPPFHLRDHALFVGYAPLENPRYAFSVVMDHAGSGSRKAAPVARDLVAWLSRHDPLGAATKEDG